jgi:hypothetical protein
MLYSAKIIPKEDDAYHQKTRRLVLNQSGEQKPTRKSVKNSRAGTFSIAYSAWASQVEKGTLHVQVETGFRTSAALSNDTRGAPYHAPLDALAVVSADALR